MMMIDTDHFFDPTDADAEPPHDGDDRDYRSHTALDRAFDRLLTHFRRADYTVNRADPTAVTEYWLRTNNARLVVILTSSFGVYVFVRVGRWSHEFTDSACGAWFVRHLEAAHTRHEMTRASH